MKLTLTGINFHLKYCSAETLNLGIENEGLTIKFCYSIKITI
jgi:hypothetical protein